MTDPLLIDYYQGDNFAPDELDVVSKDPRYVGAIIKASEGNYYNGGTFFLRHWPLIATKAKNRDWFRGAYHYLKFNLSGVLQANYYLGVIEAAGGWNPGRDLWPIVDVELGNERDTNRLASKQQVIDCTTQFAETVKKETGRQVCLYGNGAMRDLGIHDKMGCAHLWLPRYTETLPAFTYTRAGWEYPDLWQYGGDGTGFLKGYPTSTPTGRKIDHSVLTIRGGITALKKAL